MALLVRLVVLPELLVSLQELPFSLLSVPFQPGVLVLLFILALLHSLSSLLSLHFPSFLPCPEVESPVARYTKVRGQSVRSCDAD